MFTRGLAVCLTLAVVSVAQAGAVLELVPAETNVPPGGTTVEVFITQTDSGLDPLLVRMIQLDFTASDAGLAMSPVGTSGTIVDMWDYESASDCLGTCGDNHVVDADFSDWVVSSTHGAPTATEPDATVQMNLPLGVQTKIGEFLLECNGASGQVTVDPLNAADPDDDAGAQLHFGFGVNVDGTPITAWRAINAEITGGSFQVTCDVTLANLDASEPDCDDSLVRPADNCIFLEFDNTISAPGAGDVEIVPLLAGGAFGADMSADFIMTVEPGNILKIVEDGDVFSISTWYAVRNASWSGVAPFQVDYLCLYGDVDNDRTVGGLDAGQIWGARGPAIDECDRLDLDGDGTVGGLDAGQAWGGRGVGHPDKPDGHGCFP